METYGVYRWNGECVLTVQALSAAAALDIGLRRYYGYTGERQALEVFTSNSLRVMVLPKGGA